MLILVQNIFCIVFIIKGHTIQVNETIKYSGNLILVYIS